MIVVVLSTADLDAAVWTNKQYLAVGLAVAGHDVTYVESLGLRRPGLNAADVARVLRAVVRRLRPSRSSPDPRIPQSLRVISPRVLPFPELRIVRAINGWALRRQLRPVLRDAPDAVLWTFSPMTYGISGLFDRVIYHSVDLLHTIPRVPSAILLEEERGLLERADIVIASASGVRDHLVRQGRAEVRLWTNVANVDTFRAADPAIRSQAAVFAGNLTPAKVDVSALQSVVDSGVPLHLAGPIAIDGAGEDQDLGRLLQHPLVRYHGVLALPDLAALFAGCRVGLIPYLLNDYTAGVFPMKVYEYLAAGLEVVSTALPSLMETPDATVRVVESEHFGSITERLCESFTPEGATARSEGSTLHSWAARIREAERLLGARPAESTSDAAS